MTKGYGKRGGENLKDWPGAVNRSFKIISIVKNSGIMSIMSQYRRNRRRKRLEKNKITKREKYLGILAIVVIFLLAAFSVIYVAFATAR